MEEQNKEYFSEATGVSETDINKTAGIASDSPSFNSETLSDVGKQTKTEKTENNAPIENVLENNFTETKGNSDELEYATMPGCWDSYEAELKKENTSRGNGVYPNDSETPNGANFVSFSDGKKSNGSYSNFKKGSGVYPYDTNGEVNSGSYYGVDKGARSYVQNPWPGSYPNRNSSKPKDKKRHIMYGVLGTLALVIVISVAVLGFQLLGRMLDSVGDFLPESGEQSGGYGQPDASTTGNTGEGKEHLQNGSFVLEQITAEEHYKLASVYQLTESTVVAISSSVGSGSGVIIAKEDNNVNGYFIVTNNHVIKGGENIRVTLSNGATYSAKLVGRDENTDLAILRIEVSNFELKIATVGISEDLLVAEEVLIIGNPLGTLGGSATNGIISAKNRTLTIDGYEMSLLQTNAAVNPGNSGGAMFNMSGQLVGIVNAKFADEAVEGIGFAIPIDTAKAIIEDLINYGYVRGRSNLGFKVTYGINTSVDQVPSYWVTELKVGSDAAAAGLMLNDRLISIKVNGDEHIENDELPAILNTLKTGDMLFMIVRRYSPGFLGAIPNDKEIKITVTEYQGVN